MVQGLDFYNQVFEFILNEKHQLCQSKSDDINELENHVL
jgi:lycopene beta-cyclase